MERTKKKSLASQMKANSKRVSSTEMVYKESNKLTVSTGSTLLDLAISGKIKRGGGVQGGILLEAFGPEGSGKTVLLCELGGAIQRVGGDVQFNDPEARLNKVFARIHDLDMDNLTIEEPDTVTDMFAAMRNWKPRTKAPIHGIMTDSLAALSTSMEMDNEDGDKMGMRRAKEFSEGLRKACRILKQNNYIMACSNQIRVNAGASAYGEQFTVPGGKAIAFYASVRLRFHKPEKVFKEVTIAGKKVKKSIGIVTKVEVYKNSCDFPYRTAALYIMDNYGIDDIRANLQYIKDFTKNTTFTVGGQNVGVSMEDAIAEVENARLQKELKEEVIDLWESIEKKFEISRQKKERD